MLLVRSILISETAYFNLSVAMQWQEDYGFIYLFWIFKHLLNVYPIYKSANLSLFFIIIVLNGIGYSDKVKSEKGIKADYIHITHTFIIYTASPHNNLHRSVLNITQMISHLIIYTWAGNHRNSRLIEYFGSFQDGTPTTS